MSIDNKLITVAENEQAITEEAQRVYEAGKAQQEYEWWDIMTPISRTTYLYAFYGAWWDDTNYNPIRSLNPTLNPQFMFAQSSITNTKVPIILASGKNATNMGSCFRDAKKLVTIVELVVDEFVKMENHFQSAAALKNLTITGTIGKSANFQWCPLTPESMKSVILHLKNFTGTGSEYSTTVNFNDECWEALEAAALENPDEYAPPKGDTWKQYVDSLSWNA